MKSTYHIFFWIRFEDMTLVFLLLCLFTTTMLCQNDDLLNYAVNCEIFRKIITRAKYFGKYSTPFITKRSKTYYKIRQVFYYKTRQIFITKLCNLFYYKASRFVTKRRRYYKMRRLLQNAVQHLVQHVLIVFWITWFVIGDFIWN